MERVLGSSRFAYGYEHLNRHATRLTVRRGTLMSARQMKMVDPLAPKRHGS
jgi:hypothetical protein